MLVDKVTYSIRSVYSKISGSTFATAAINATVYFRCCYYCYVFSPVLLLLCTFSNVTTVMYEAYSENKYRFAVKKNSSKVS